MLRGTCHMLSESGLKQKPIKCKQDRQPDPSQRGGGEQRARGGGCCVCLCVQACVYVCFCFFLNEEMVAVETFWINL